MQSTRFFIAQLIGRPRGCELPHKLHSFRQRKSYGPGFWTVSTLFWRPEVLFRFRFLSRQQWGWAVAFCSDLLGVLNERKSEAVSDFSDEEFMNQNDPKCISRVVIIRVGLVIL